MKKLLGPGLCFLMVFCSVNAYSQRLESPIRVYPQRLETPVKIAHPDFSGTWKYNPVKPGVSEPNSAPDNSLLVIIEQRLPVLFVTVVVKEDDKDMPLGTITLYTDGRGDEFSGLFDSNNSTTQWQGNKLVITFFSSSKGFNEVRDVTEMELSSDGNILTGTRRGTKIGQGPNGKSVRIVDNTKNETAFFNRVSDTGAKSDKIPLPAEK
jgi:hypothetical protein